MQGDWFSSRRRECSLYGFGKGKYRHDMKRGADEELVW